MLRMTRAMRAELVLVVAVLALAVPVSAQAFVPANPAVPQGNSAATTTTVGWSGRDIGLAIVFGAATVLVAVGLVELTRPHDHGHRHTPTTA
jgi:hypothetical protein